MSTPPFESVGNQTVLIDCGLYRPQLAGCYLVHDSGEVAVIDCGTWHSVPRILDAIRSLGARPEDVRWILPTHVHLDHAGGAGRLAQSCPRATLATHPKGLPHMIDPSRLQAGATAVYGQAAFARDFGSLDPIPASRCIPAGDGQTFQLGQRTLRYIHTPGHANHHGCIFDSSSGYLFSGDAFGLGYRELATPTPYIVATTTPVAFAPEEWQASLDRMLALEPSAVCLTHYGKYHDPIGLAPQLRASIQAHADIALKEELNADDAARETRLERAVADLLVNGASKHCGISSARAREILASDISLNAQGLKVWLARRAKHRSA